MSEVNKYSWVLLLLILWGCSEKSSKSKKEEGYVSPYDNSSFSAYWDQGKAELNNYDLKQFRYGEVRNGHAVLIFVTEDFSKSKQVKLDNPQDDKDDALHILKMNFTKKFVTGIYPYSMMLSVFTPLNGYPKPVKITTSSQEWCGHTFTQFNLKDSKYQGNLYSYFEKEGDKQISIEENAFPEDGIWNLIRTNPDALPQGKIKIIPGTLYQRLSHTSIQPIEVNATLTEATNKYDNIDDSTLQRYTLKHIDGSRQLTIDFSKNFPYYILGWEEVYSSGNPGKRDTTSATLRERIMTDYWRHNGLADSVYRDSLQVR